MRLPPDQIFLSLPAGNGTSTFNGFVARSGDTVLHARGGTIHHRIGPNGRWGLISISPEQLASHSMALTGKRFVPPDADRILRPAPLDSARLRRLFGQACHLSERGHNLIESSEVARALEQQMLHAIIHCLSANRPNDTSRTRHQHAAVMARFEQVLSMRIDQKLTMPALRAELGVPERTLRMCCAEFLGISPTRYILLQRLNRARAALRCADPSTSSVAKIAQNHLFFELGRFAVTYHSTFGESPSVTLRRAAIGRRS